MARIRQLVAAVVAGLWLLMGAAPATADPAHDYVKYYVVTSAYAGKPETMSEIAERFLGGAARAGDVVILNAGREQPGAAAVTGPDQPLTMGWAVLLPWDAVGVEVVYGKLPDTPAATGSGPRCAAGSSLTDDAHWADAALGVTRSWTRGKGTGVLVAVVDSGVDAGAGALAGRVATGADVTNGKAGDTDCLGSGTAMAGLIVSPTGSGVLGVAPEATVFPVRVVGTETRADPTKVAAGIEIAVSAGARVIALGGYVDADDPAVRPMIEAAVAHDVLVVASAGSRDGARSDDGLLRVGGVGVDGQTTAAYATGSVEVTAPGIDVATVGTGSAGVRTASGTAYAVAYAAGTAALVRADFPNMDARQVERRVERTSSGGSRSEPDLDRGYGMINPRAAVDTATATMGRDTPAWWLAITAVAVAVLGVAAALIWRRLRSARTAQRQ